jgi:hypothetical protein
MRRRKDAIYPEAHTRISPCIQQFSPLSADLADGFIADDLQK